MKKARILQWQVASAVLAVGVLTLLCEATVIPNSASTSPPDGAAIYARRCAICHAKDGAGLPNWRAKGQPSLTNADWQKSHTDSQISETIKSGKGKYMPSFKQKLSDEEVGALVAYIRHFSK